MDERVPSAEEVLRSYVGNPRPNDRMCREDIEKAKKDLKKYKDIYVSVSCFGCEAPPYEDEILEYAVKEKVKVINDAYSCVVIEGQTQRCYKTFIDLRMEETHGKDFRQKIEQAAEQLMIQKVENGNKVLSIYDLKEDDKPHFIKEDDLIKQGYIPTIKTGLPLKHDRDNYPFMDISFIIEKDGSIGNLKNGNWVSGFKENDKYKNELENIAKNIILANYSQWKPGKYKNTIARVENNFRVNFK